jgi:hypothetical protein
MRFSIFGNWGHSPIATVDIDRGEHNSYFDNLGNAVKLAIAKGKNLWGANLWGANLQDADLSNASFCSASLRFADFTRAKLWGADFRGTDLRGAKGLPPEMVQPLLFLRDQPGKIRMYKLVTADGQGPYHRGILYEIGKTVSVKSANTNDWQECAEGISVGTLDWCFKHWKEGYRILIVEFEAKDIAAIPTAADGKIRLFRCTVVAEKELNYVALGLKKPTE